MPTQQCFSSIDLPGRRDRSLKILETALTAASIELNGWAPACWSAQGTQDGCSGALELKSVDESRQLHVRLEVSVADQVSETSSFQMVYETDADDSAEVLAQVFDKTETVLKTTLTM